MEFRFGLEPNKTWFAITRLDHFGIRNLAGDRRIERRNIGFGVRRSPNRACPPWSALLDSNQQRPKATDFEPAALPFC
jgi:hypothetical protein